MLLAYVVHSKSKQYLPGLFDTPLHVKYTTYNVTTED